MYTKRFSNIEQIFYNNLNKAFIEDIKLLLNDGSRIVGITGYKTNCISCTKICLFLSYTLV